VLRDVQLMRILHEISSKYGTNCFNFRLVYRRG